MSQKIVHRFDVRVASPDALADAEVRLRQLGRAGVHFEIERVERPPLLKVALQGDDTRALAATRSSVACSLSILNEVTRGIDGGGLETAYPDPRIHFRMGVEPGLPARTITSRSPGVTVAIVDSGLMIDHPDLQDHLWPGPGQPPPHGARCVDGLNDADVTDRDGHGTRLAGTVLATAEFDPGLRFMPVKFCDVDVLPRAANAAAAIDFAVDNAADIILLSFDLGLGSPALEQAIQNACDHDVLVVIAAGNSGTDNDSSPAVPARYGRHPHGPPPPSIITVMATNRHGEKASFSNYGLTTVDLAAPGTDVMTTRAAVTGASGVGARPHRRYTGTSAAAAHVAGAAALIKLRNPSWGSTTLKDCLVNSADPFPPLKCRSGRLNLTNALGWSPPGSSATST